MHSLVILKPDAVRRGLFPYILGRLQAFARFDRLELRTLTAEQTRSLYWHHAVKPFFPRVESFMTSGPSVVCVVSDPNSGRIINEARMFALLTRDALRHPERDENQAANVIHASESYEDARREIDIFYPEFPWLPTATSCSKP